MFQPHPAHVVLSSHIHLFAMQNRQERKMLCFYSLLALLNNIMVVFDSFFQLFIPWLARLYRLHHDILFTIRICWGLHRTPKNRIPVCYHALRCHSAGPVACCYTRRGRMYFMKRPSQIRQVLTNKQSFEKLKSPRNSPLAKILGEAITTSGDDPIAWLAAKRSMRSCHIPAMIPAFHSISQILVKRAQNWTKHSTGVQLYNESLCPAIEASYNAFFGVNLEAELKRREASYTIYEYAQLVDIFSNTYLAAGEEDVDRFSNFTRKLCQDFLAQAPASSFGGSIQRLVEDEADFTLSMGIGNALFYVHALPVMTAIVAHWTIYTLMVRHPEHLGRIRRELVQGERSYFRMCLKEIIRLYHPAAFMARRVKKNVVVDGVVLSRGSLIIPWVKLLDQDFTFQPDRWEGNCCLIDEVTDDTAGIMYAPFAFGARSCLGKEMVTSIFEDTIAQLLQSFDFELLDKDPWKETAPALSHCPDMMVGFKPNHNLRFLVKERTCSSID